MLRRVWNSIKDNVAAYITVITAILTVVYALLKLCVYVYWKGYFTRLSIDVGVMNMDFDKTIFAVVFVAIVLFVVFFFLSWVKAILTDIKNKVRNRGVKGIGNWFYIIKMFGLGLFMSLGILSLINIPLILLCKTGNGVYGEINNTLLLIAVLYALEMLFVLFQMVEVGQSEESENVTERKIAMFVIKTLVYILIVLATIYYAGGQAIEQKKSVQLVEKEQYMISYCSGDYFVLHKVKYEENRVVIYKNEQKIVGIENCEYIIRSIDEVDFE